MRTLEPYDFFFELPLYTKIIIDEANSEKFEDLFMSKKKIDAYSYKLGENTTYEVDPLKRNYPGEFFSSGGYDEAVMSCVRTEEVIKVFYHYDSNLKILQKIGQYPSIATMHISKIKQYNKVLSAQHIKEFSRAIGLAANGVGIGSFVYLRRIFEKLIEEAHSKAITNSGWDEETFTKARMADKIQILEDYLPDFLVQNKQLYSILSIGIHSLEENECLTNFDTVKIGIELILDEKLEALERKKKIDEAQRKILALSHQVKPK